MKSSWNKKMKIAFYCTCLIVLQVWKALCLNKGRRKEDKDPRSATQHEALVVSRLCGITASISPYHPTYITDLVQPPSVQRSLRSSNKGLLHVPRSGLKQRADRAFGVAAPRLWNHLPLDIRSAPSISAFKPRLKTYLYSLAFLVP